jgi:hypothetical protein
MMKQKKDQYVADISKVMGKFFLDLNKYHAFKTYWELEVKIHLFLTSALAGGELSASRPGYCHLIIQK